MSNKPVVLSVFPSLLLSLMITSLSLPAPALPYLPISTLPLPTFPSLPIPPHTSRALPYLPISPLAPLRPA